MSLEILGIGTAAPQHSITQCEAVELARVFLCLTERQERLLPALYRRTRVQQRGVVVIESANGFPRRQTFFPKAVTECDRGPSTGQRIARYSAEVDGLVQAAAQRALDHAGLKPAEITHLITVSCTGFAAPGADIHLIRLLRLPPTVQRTHIGFMGCHGALNALRVARAFADADPRARILLACVEICSLHFQYGWDPEKVVANALFADGAAGLVARPASEAAGDRDCAWRAVANGSVLMPDSEDAMTWTITDHGFEMTLSPRVPDLIQAHLRPWLCEWLGTHGLALTDVESWAIHPGGPRIVDAVAEALALPEAATVPSRRVLAEHGNMSSPTVLFILDELRRARASRPCVALGFGPGLVAEAALFR